MDQFNQPYDLAVVGEINPDLILSGDVVPRFGQVEQILEGMTLTIGSSACIFACGAARLGLRVLFLGKVGEDEFGRFMLQAMQARQINTSNVKIDPHIRTGASIILNRGSDRAILTFPGAIPLLEMDDIPLESLSQARHLHLTSYFIQDRLRPSVPDLFAHARELGLTTSLDTNYDPSGHWDGGLADVLALTDVFFPNETEACAIAKTEDVDRAAAALAKQIPLVVVKQGAKGAFALSGTQRTTQPALPIAVVDTVGAGDTFDSGFLYAHLHAWDLERCLQLGVACGTLSTRAAGGTNAQPTLVEALAFLNL
jgi:sugar/nucleoside kinase (ribokinase family)